LCLKQTYAWITRFDACNDSNSFFCKINVFLLLGELPQRNIPYVIEDWKWAEEIDLRVMVLFQCDIASSTWSVWFFQFKWLSVCKPRNSVFLLLYPEFNRSQKSAVCIETGYGLGSQWVGVWVLVGAGFFAALCHPDWSLYLVKTCLGWWFVECVEMWNCYRYL
jgi:hypothetical protein